MLISFLLLSLAYNVENIILHISMSHSGCRVLKSSVKKKKTDIE